ncbi:MAG: ThuA domain-containing protein [Verrucomicrobiota bacterium]|nr:ThuA domain-containing protein [Verrucomicrobiota bacterium]MED5453632.1 ThuA domain-containing protein [Verrucomicrobiota bacterium]|tara:strand:- start:133 stop:1056 length:924 start_codon:yes stop_codon:yes gene_type:complete
MNSLIHKFQLRGICVLVILGLTVSATWAKDKINVLIWDEQQQVSKKVYPNYPGNFIANYLKQNSTLNITSANINQPQQGLSTEALNKADVLIYWGHVRHRDITESKSQEIVDLVKSGKLDFIALHSAHWAVPFMVAMQEVAAQDAIAQLPEEIRDNIEIQFKGQIRWEKAPDSARPHQLHEFSQNENGQIKISVERPNCVFPRCCTPVQPSQIRIINKKHPITQNVPDTFSIPETEMYDEPFHIPTPDEVILDETWKGGEYFRSGAIWTLGKGKVFYFRPGDQQYAVYKLKPVLKIIENATVWLGGN